jgi:acyclic terpene utilization AtuA family protein
MSSRHPVLIGNGQGFWGDSAVGPVQLVTGGPLHYLTLDYLAEVTMSILQKARARNPALGYAPDFVSTVERILPLCRERNIRIVANAGGVNPRACAEAVAAVAKKAGATGTRIGVVEGDDILHRLPDLLAAGETFTNLDTGEHLGPRAGRVQSANAYLGAAPIVEALADGADIVITGRCADASLTVAPLVHEHGWKLDDHDLIAAATVGGHVIECGTQCTGGNFEDWRRVPDLRNIGYPVLESHHDGTLIVTKHPGTGGLVDVDTVIAQLLYEIGDPRSYVTPDVVADFTSVSVMPDGADRVRITGARGRAPTDTYKVSCTMGDGYKAVGQLTMAGPDAVEKAVLLADLLFDRLGREGVSFDPEQRLVECVGAGVCFAGMDAARDEPPEVVLRVAVRSNDKAAVERFGMEVASMLLSGPPGATGFAGGRPKAAEVLAHWPALVARASIPATVTVEEVR